MIGVEGGRRGRRERKGRGETECGWEKGNESWEGWVEEEGEGR